MQPLARISPALSRIEKNLKFLVSPGTPAATLLMKEPQESELGLRITPGVARCSECPCL